MIDNQHVDEFIEDSFSNRTKSVKYARWVLMHFRLPATLRSDFSEFMEDKKLFCTFNGSRFKVIGASRLGDVWLTSNLDGGFPYKYRVSVDECSQWGDSK